MIFFTRDTQVSPVWLFVHHFEFSLKTADLAAGYFILRLWSPPGGGFGSSCQKVTEQLVQSVTHPFRPFKLRELPVKRSYEQKQLYECEQFTLLGSFDKTAINSLKDDLSAHFTCKPESPA